MKLTMYEQLKEKATGKNPSAGWVNPPEWKTVMRNGKPKRVYGDGTLEYLYSDKLTYYRPHYRDNLFEPPHTHLGEFEKAAGRETRKTGYGVYKMAAVHSSSALLFNTLGDGETVTVKPGGRLPAGVYMTEYEKQLPAVKGRTPAHLDAYLQSGENGIFIESKMLEYLESAKKNLADAYLDHTTYYLAELDQQAAGEFEDIFREVSGKQSDSQYDLLQILKHCLAILTFVKQAGENAPKKIVLVNSVWQAENVDFLNAAQAKAYHEKWERETAGADAFKEKYLFRIQTVFKKALGDAYSFDFRFLTWRELKNELAISAERERYLERYLL